MLQIDTPGHAQDPDGVTASTEADPSPGLLEIQHFF